MKWTILQSVTMIRTGAAFDDLELDLFTHDGVACYDVISGVDRNNATALTTFGIKRGTSEFLLATYAAPAANVVVATVTRIFAPAEARPFMRVSGGSAGDTLELFVFGYLNTDMTP
jgi:hypothetical protein